MLYHITDCSTVSSEPHQEELGRKLVNCGPQKAKRAFQKNGRAIVYFFSRPRGGRGGGMLVMDIFCGRLLIPDPAGMFKIHKIHFGQKFVKWGPRKPKGLFRKMGERKYYFEVCFFSSPGGWGGVALVMDWFSGRPMIRQECLKSILVLCTCDTTPPGTCGTAGTAVWWIDHVQDSIITAVYEIPATTFDIIDDRYSRMYSQVLSVLHQKFRNCTGIRKLKNDLTIIGVVLRHFQLLKYLA